MKAHPLWHISVVTSAEGEEAVAALLERLFGLLASVYVEAETQARTVNVYCPKSTARSKREALAAGLKYIEDCGLEIAPAKITIQKVRRQNWAESWKKFFKAIEIGRSLLIKPTWNKRRPRKDQAVVILDPGLSFGTGQHATTAFCLRQIVSCRKLREQQSFLDIGTGSGILAIAAAKLGYRPVRAFDVDPVAVRIAKANAARNRVQDRVSIGRADLPRLPLGTKTQYDLICANLTDTLLLQEVERIVNRLKPGGRLVLAGILATQFLKVQKAYEATGVTLLRTSENREWQSVIFKAPAPAADASKP